MGEPSSAYPLPWSVQTWLPGVVAAEEDPGESVAFGHDLAEFVAGVRAIDTRGRTFSGDGRGGDLKAHDRWMQTCFARSEQILDVSRLRRMWHVMRGLPRAASGDVMCHGDLIPGNVLVSGGRLAGVLDVGGVGPADPALDWWARGTCSTPAPGDRSETTWSVTTWSGSAARRGPSTRRWASSGTTSTATRP